MCNFQINRILIIRIYCGVKLSQIIVYPETWITVKVIVLGHVTAFLFWACTYFALQSQSPSKRGCARDRNGVAENSKILSKLNHDQQSSEVTQEVPKTKKCVLDANIIATLVRTKIKCGAATVVCSKIEIWGHYFVWAICCHFLSAILLY